MPLVKSCVLLLLGLLLPETLRGQEGTRVEEVGLGGFYSPAVPTPVRILIPALPETQTIQLDLTIELGTSGLGKDLSRVDRFQEKVQVISGKPLEVEVPILLDEFPPRTLRVLARDSHGQKIGEANVGLGFLKEPSGGPLIAIYCDNDQNCLDAQAQLTRVPTGEEGPTLTTQPTFALLRKLRRNWWDYSSTPSLVLAGSLSGVSAEQRKALEYYLRSGGTLILLEKEVEDPSFLAAYREGEISPEFTLVGVGRLFRLPSLKSGGLRNLIRERPERPFGVFVPYFGGFSASTALQDFGISFSFPRLPWLLAWIAIYILVIGPANFAILRRRRRLDWGWVSVCVTAVLFAAALYFTSSARRPKNFTLDTVRLYRMDDRSPVAYQDLGVRVSSPERTEVAVSTGDDVVLKAPWSLRYQRPTVANIGESVTGKSRMEPGWQVQLGPRLEVELSLLRWSFRDLYFQGFREFPGTVHWTSGKRLRNDTGQRFREAMYFDSRTHKWFVLPPFAPGDEIDLAGVVPQDTWKAMKKDYAAGLPKEESSALRRLVSAGIGLGPANRVFLGLNAAPAANERLGKGGVSERALALTVVSLDQP